MIAKSPKASDTKVGDPEEFQTVANLHAEQLRELMAKMGHTEVTIEVVPVDVA